MANAQAALSLMFFILLMDVVGISILYPVAPYIVRRYSGDALMLTVLTAIYAAAQFFAAPLLGKLGDRYGRRPVLLVSLFGSVIGYVLFGIGGALWVLFLVQHNRLFLAYVAVLGCSLWALIGSMATTDWREIKAQFAANTPVRVVSLFLLVRAVLFYLMWLGDEVPPLLTGAVPQSIKDMGVPTNPVHVLDLSMMLPSMALAAVWLWGKQAIGYGLAAMMLVNGLFQNVGIASVMVFSIRAGLPGEAGPVTMFIALAVVGLALLAWYLRGMKAPAR